MLLFSIKLISAIIIGLTALTATWLAKRAQLFPKASIYLTSLSHGLFIGVALFHLLPESITLFHTTTYRLSFSYLLCFLGFLISFIIENGSYHLLKKHKKKNQKQLAYLTTGMLCIHSLLAGILLGNSQIKGNIIALFLAIIAHKGFAAFALATILIQRLSSQITYHVTTTFFCLITPLGIILPIFSKHFAHYLVSNTLLTASLMAVMAGNFLYLGIFHHTEQSSKGLAAMLGMLITAVLAFYSN